MLWGCVTPERYIKTHRLMHALTLGWPGGQIVIGPPPPTADPFAVWGQEWLTLSILPAAALAGRPFYHVDNGFYKPARGGVVGYYRITYRGLSPIFLKDAVRERGLRIGWADFKPWRKTGRHILLALPGRSFGRSLGIDVDVDAWFKTVRAKIAKHSDRIVVVREKTSARLLAYDLQQCWAVVTHSSNVAVDAVRAGVPVFVAPTNPAAPVGNLDLSTLENPAMPPRESWWGSLMCQQFTLTEMRDGTAYRQLSRVVNQVDSALKLKRGKQQIGENP